MNPLRAGGVMELRSGVCSSHGAGGEWVIVATPRVCTDQRPLALEGGMLPAPPPHSFLHKEKTGQETTVSGELELFFTYAQDAEKEKDKVPFPN